MTKLLISVRSVAEAMIALEAGADLIDLKEPDAGALGAVASDVANDAVRAIAGRRRSSATVGDLPARVDALAEAVMRTAATGVDFVKIGLMPEASVDIDAVIRGLAPVARHQALIAVLFADRMPTGDPVAAAREAGFAGVMVDTADKSAGSLRDCMADADLARFVRSVREAGMLAGLAGSLRAADIAPLAALGPDYLGFRGAACAQHQRGASLQAERVRELRGLLDTASVRRPSPASVCEP